MTVSLFQSFQDETFAYWFPLITFWLFFFVCYRLSGFCSYLASSTYRALSKEDQVEWNSRMVSTAHAFMACVGGIYGTMYDPIMANNFVFGTSLLSEMIVCNTTAYWIFDFMLIMRYFKKLGEPGIILHHIIGIIPFSLGRLHSELIFYGCFMILTELSTPFVNNRWFLAIFREQNPKSNYLNQLEIVNGMLIWLSFVICRVFMLPYLLYHMYTSRVQLLKGHIEVYAIVIFGCIMVTFLSYFWFWKITKGVWKKLQQILHKKKHS